MADTQENKSKGKQGFASMQKTPEGIERQKEIAARGGRQAHRKGKAHEWTSKEAAEAGRKGGKARAANRRANMENNNEDQNQPTTDTDQNSKGKNEE